MIIDCQATKPVDSVLTSVKEEFVPYEGFLSVLKIQRDNIESVRTVLPDVEKGTWGGFVVTYNVSILK